MEGLKKELNKIAKKIREENKHLWGKKTRDKLILTMGKSQMTKKGFTITSWGNDLKTINGETLEEIILKEFGVYGELVYLYDDKDELYRHKKYHFNIKEIWRGKK